MASGASRTDAYAEGSRPCTSERSERHPRFDTTFLSASMLRWTSSVSVDQLLTETRPSPGSAAAEPEPASPFYGSSKVLAALARPPAREIPGSARFVLRPEFDTIPETRTETAERGIFLGHLLDRERLPAGPLTIPRASLNRHAFVCGATGAGKS